MVLPILDAPTGDLLSLQIFLQDHRGGHGIDRSACGFAPLLVRSLGVIVENLAGVIFQQALRFPTRQALIDHFDGDAELLANALAEAAGFFGHFAARSVEAQRQSYDDLLDAVSAHDFAETPHVFVAVDARQRVERLRQRGSRVGECEADARAAVVDTEDTGSPDFAGEHFFRVAIGWRHGSIIPGSWVPGI